MAAHNTLGRVGEEIAVQYLLSINYKVLATNYRFSRAEVDIIAKEGNILVFVEVKTRSRYKNEHPELSISARKVRLLMDAAYTYMDKIGHNWEIRFDVISVISAPRCGISIKHLIDAFVP